MTYKLRLDELQKGYRFVSESKFNIRLTHLPGKRIRILPFKASPLKQPYDDFKLIIGEFSRLASKKELLVELEHDQLLKAVIDRVQTKQPMDEVKLKSIIQTLFIDDKGDIEIFHPAVFNYFSSQNTKEHVQLAEFLYSVLWSEALSEKLLILYSNKPTNILLRLVYEALPQLESIQQTRKIPKYKILVSKVIEQFQKDVTFLMQDHQLFIENFEKLIRYYYFFYISQLARSLNVMFKAQDKIEPLYFNLDWENTSRSRTSYIEGWRLLESVIKPLFSHVNTLEMLNYHENDGESYTYIDLNNRFSELSSEEKDYVIEQMNTLISSYKEHVSDVNWERFHFNISSSENDFTKKVHELFKVIDYQFDQSPRQKPYDQYQSWFSDYCKQYFLRKRGSMGYTLNLTEDYLMFLTKLSMGNQEKIRLVLLFEEYQKRGIVFDRDSRDRIVSLFEKLNLLEKKSDSGDAQYVKSIL
ncbi:DNA phosphorothioation-dependent restriction protein DptG [Paenibacillus athensensis]|uniref:DNA phosphorothioation-dependent restriction protein DptG n=1 Tax=Paenibacillus athensensis TaxID=1967502 RepID=A0A4Y8PR14_9BACL|nr:DNA phosphorothioation-dependent restriction protein DptG [Paenibacillus athensensis]MCD1262003.1 DNA phosphorothioation-dependent restriction protein DptG [Paenibacillus athensensis]